MQIIGRSRIPISRILQGAIWILVFSFFAADILYTQESIKKEVSDSLDKTLPINKSLLHSFQNNIIIPPSIDAFPKYWPGFLHQSLTILPSSLSWQFQQQVDVVSPWKQELAKQKELRTFRLILQAVTAGGTAYLLYEHIDKYGLK